MRIRGDIIAAALADDGSLSALVPKQAFAGPASTATTQTSHGGPRDEPPSLFQDLCAIVAVVMFVTALGIIGRCAMTLTALSVRLVSAMQQTASAEKADHGDLGAELQKYVNAWKRLSRTLTMQQIRQKKTYRTRQGDLATLANVGRAARPARIAATENAVRHYHRHAVVVAHRRQMAGNARQSNGPDGGGAMNRIWHTSSLR
jgi:hypothetical protein